MLKVKKKNQRHKKIGKGDQNTIDLFTNNTTCEMSVFSNGRWCCGGFYPMT